ncbi:MAG: TIGR04551 family protein [Deltaproteobacteria bacterium]|nr:TIGR04551 family protein [Deltaproteobacteria bacterium]
MHRWIDHLCFLLLLSLTALGPAGLIPSARAQVPDGTEDGAGAADTEETAGDAIEEQDVEETDEEDDVAAEEDADDAEPRLRAPTLEPIDLGDAGDAAGDGGWAEDGEEAGDAEPSGDAGHAEHADDAGHDAAMLDEGGPPSSDPTEPDWTSPQTVFTMHGYLRMRAELQDTFFLGRDGLPFSIFQPIDRGALPAGGCRGAATVTPDATNACSGGSDRLRFVNMRMRLAPTLALSDDVKVHMMIDVFDNMVLGSTPDSQVYLPPGAPGNFTNDTAGGQQWYRPLRTPGVPLDSFTATSNPPQAYRNSLQDSIYVRRAWAEVTNRGLGQLRFGRMGSQWGLGVLANSGDGIDSDFSSDVDRVMAMTRLAGFYLVLIRDFAGEGYIIRDPADVTALPFDATQKDDIRQWVLAVAHREDPETQRTMLQRGDWVLNGGVYFVMRKQFLSTAGITDPFATQSSASGGLVRRGTQAYIPDLWGQFLWGDLRLEAEAVYIAGQIKNVDNTTFSLGNYKVRQFGFAFEGEYRLLDDHLGLSFYGGYASGDADVDGLSARAGLLAQQTDNRTISAFNFHPNYRIDLILWRSIMGRISGAYYFRPGISYDIIRNSFGQLLGGRVDVVYSRASSEVQTYGSDPNLGVEIDASLYYRSEDGPGPTDGFYAQLQYGLLFPMAGLGYPSYSVDPRATQNPAIAGGNPSLNKAQTLRLILGVQY